VGSGWRVSKLAGGCEWDGLRGVLGKNLRRWNARELPRIVPDLATENLSQVGRERFVLVRVPAGDNAFQGSNPGFRVQGALDECFGLFAALEIPASADSRKRSRRNDYVEAALAMHGNSPHRGISGLPVNSNA
jgi:hypothetical protein